MDRDGAEALRPSALTPRERAVRLGVRVGPREDAMMTRASPASQPRRHKKHKREENHGVREEVNTQRAGVWMPRPRAALFLPYTGNRRTELARMVNGPDRTPHVCLGTSPAQPCVLEKDVWNRD